ncbi:MAG: hypothetical protein RLZ55_1743 [Actinomycetota bacterium]
MRKVRTGSGATAVQIAEYSAGRKRIVAHIGSAHTPAELGVLLERARAMLEDPAQGVLDIDAAQPERAVEDLVEEPAAEQALFDEPAERPATRRAGAGRVTGTASRVLFDAVAGVYDGLGFGALGDDVFRDLVVARVVEPTSLLDTGRVLDDLGRDPASYATMKRALTRALASDYRATIAERCFERAGARGDISLILYDVTTLYFEAEKEDGLRRIGYSKERRVDPQIVVGLLVDREGFPLEIGCFEGNKAETATLLPVVKGFQDRHGIADMVIVADAGMLSAANLAALDDAGLRFIVGSRMTKAPIDLASHFRWHGDAFADGQIIDTITPKTGRHRGENDPAKRAEPVWDPELHPGSWRAVWAFSRSRSARDNKTLTAQENRARAVVDGEKAARTPRFVKAAGQKRVLDEDGIARARAMAGLKGYVTNIEASIMDPGEVISSYHDLWQVERSFRMSKTDLRARPMFHRTRDAIEAHLTIVFAALAVARAVQQATGLAIRRVVRQLLPLRSATLAINGAQQTFPPLIDDDRQAILDALAASS